MRLLTEFLSTKVKLHQFPYKCDKDLILNYLNDKGFNHIVTKGDDNTFTNMAELLEKSKEPAYILGAYDDANDYSKYITFSNGGQITKSNPMFFIRTPETIEDIGKYSMWETKPLYGEINHLRTTFEKYEDFVEETNKYI